MTRPAGDPGDPDRRPLISLVVVNYRTMPLAEELVAMAAPACHEIVVVDNDSFTGDRAALERRHPGVRFVWLASNRGYGAAANAGATLTTGDVLVVSNADIRIDPGSLSRLAAQVGAGTGVGLAAPRFVDLEGNVIRSSHRREPLMLATVREYCAPAAAVAERLQPGWHPTLRRPEEHGKDHDALHVLGALMAVDAGVFRRLGGFDEGFFLYREETDLCLRVTDAGFRVRHVAGAAAVHIGDAASAGDPRPVAVRPAAVVSHYRYVAKRRGRGVAAAAWLTGVAGSLLWLLAGPHRPWARASLAGHWSLVTSRPGRRGCASRAAPTGRGAARQPSPPS